MGNLLRRLSYWMHQRNLERELAEELEFHRAMKREELEREGLSSDEAAAGSSRALGNVLLAREDARAVWIWPWLDQLWQDCSYAFRQLRRNPGFTIIAVLTLAIGIGANTAMFTIVNSVLLEALPYKDPRQLLLMFEQLPNAPTKFGFSPPDYEFIRKEARSFSGMAAYQNVSFELSGIAESRRLAGARIAPEMFSVLGVAPAIGRSITPDDDRQRSNVVVLSYSLWSGALRRDPGVIGRAILLDRKPYTVVGIMPQSFEFPPRGMQLNGEPSDVFVPMSFSQIELQGFGMRYSNTVVARLKLNVSIDQARAEMATLLKPLLTQYPPVVASFVNGYSIPVAPFDEEVVGRSRRMLLVLMATVGMVLLIGCADVANLILTRSSSRQREIAVRSSLGAGPMRIVRQLITEATLLAAAGGSLGLLIAYFSMRSLLAFSGQTLPRAESIAMNYRVIAFTAVIALATPLIFGLLPAFRAAFGSDAETLKNNALNATPGHTRSRLLGSFVIVQVALALVLSVGAGLLVRSFVRLLNTDPGFRPEQVVRLSATLPSGKYSTTPQVRSFYQQAIEAAERIPGVASAGAGNDLPLRVRERRAFAAEGNTRQIPDTSRLIAPTWISPGYFQALGVPLKRGRFFTDADNRNSQLVVIINEALARTFWPDADPMGSRIKWGIEASLSPWMTIVGVVGDVKQASLDTPAIPQVYVPLSQEELRGDLFRTVNLVLRSSRDADSLISDIRSSVRALDPELPLNTQPLTGFIAESVKPQRFSMSIVMLFAAIALCLAAIGIYGVLSNVVSQQTHEIGLRVALGATAGDVMRMVLRRAMTLLAIGVGVGVAGAFAFTQLMSGLLYEVRPTDATAFLGAALTLALLALLASVVPAWRATRVDPLIALKIE